MEHIQTWLLILATLDIWLDALCDLLKDGHVLTAECEYSKQSQSDDSWQGT